MQRTEKTGTDTKSSGMPVKPYSRPAIGVGAPVFYLRKSAACQHSLARRLVHPRLEGVFSLPARLFAVVLYHYRIQVFKESAVLIHGTDTNSNPFG